MAEWLIEHGIGETRAALVADAVILRAAIELDDGAVRVGGVCAGRLAGKLPGGGVRVMLDHGGEEVVLARPPTGVTEGASLRVAITRTALPEPGRAKPARGVATDAVPHPGPTLADRIAATGYPVRKLRAHESDVLEAAGWSELLEEAMTGEIAFAGGALRLSPTPAMTLFDVDGPAPLDALALRAATAVAAAIQRMEIGGSIGIDFPTLAGKAPRQAVAEAVDAALPPPFERTTVNGFGFLQIVRPRPRASLPELLRADPIAAAARAALRNIERTPPGAATRHRLPPAVHALLAARPDWLAELARRTGAVPLLES